jgi:ADP-ribose pyrophosphatase YjhB (NUDIX family)
MPLTEQTVRPLAVCVFRRDDDLFVAEGYDPTKRQVFYRPLGGAIEFGEHGRETVVREIREEIGQEITDLRYLGALENIFTYDGQPGHEIVLVYEARFADTALYQESSVKGMEDGDVPFQAVWKPIAGFERGEAPLYPEGLLQLL